MDPFTALLIATLVTWGTVGGGIKDTAAIAKGQPPPSHAYRMAKLQAKQDNGGAGARGAGGAGARTARTRRITLTDLMRHWWEDALEDADHWRAHRHKSRPERKEARKAWRQRRKDQVKQGYALLKQRGQNRFGPEPSQQAADKPSQQPAQDPAPGAPDRSTNTTPDGGEGDSNVVPLHPRTTSTDSTEEVAMQLQLADKNTYAGHQDALSKYQDYYKEVADRLERITARVYEQQFSTQTVAQGHSAMHACGLVKDRAAAASRSLAQAHQAVAEQRAATSNRADADYLTT